MKRGRRVRPCGEGVDYDYGDEDEEVVGDGGIVSGQSEAAREAAGRGSHSSTSQLNLSRFGH